MHSRIVVPLDGSVVAESALRPAVSIALRTQAQLLLAMVHQSQVTPASPITAMDLESRVRNQESRYLTECAERITAESGVPVAWALLDGPVTAALVASVRSRRAMLVVMTTHGRGGIGRFFLGSTADRLIRQLHCPILLTHSGEAAAPDLGVGPRVLVPLDGSPRSEAILDQLATVFPATTELELVRVAVPPMPAPLPFAGAPGINPEMVEQLHQEAEEYLQAVADRLRRNGLAVRAGAVVDLSPAMAIAERARARRCDVIAIATRGIGGLERALLGSVADKVVRGTEIPVLVWNPPDDGARNAIAAEAPEAVRGSRAVAS